LGWINILLFQRWADSYFGLLVRCPLFAAQRTTEMIADQWTGKNSEPALADYQNGASAIPLLCIFCQFLKILWTSGLVKIADQL
jgi:hypothetical protein